MEEDLRAEQARKEVGYHDRAVRAEAKRLAQAARLAEERALQEASAREHQRAQEAACLLKAAQQAEHSRGVHEAAEKADLLRREEVLLVARRQAKALTAPLGDTQKQAQDALTAGAAQVKAAEAAMKSAAKAERTARAKATSKGVHTAPAV
jgi:hypothetical protein